MCLYAGGAVERRRERMREMTRSNAREIAVHFTFELGFSDLNADELLERNTYSYDASGRLYKLTRYDVNGALECCVIYQYKD